jgi:hypothetical protein
MKIAKYALLIVTLAIGPVVLGCGKKEQKETKTKAKEDEGGAKARERPPVAFNKERAKEARAKRSSERLQLRADAEKVFGVGPRLSMVRARTVAATMGVKPNQVMDLLLGRPIARIEGDTVKIPAVPADQVVAQPTVEQIRAEMKKVREIPAPEKPAALASFAARYKLDAKLVVKAVYGIEPGQKPGDNRAALAEMKIIQRMRNEQAKSQALIQLTEATGFTPDQMSELAAAVGTRR